MRDYCIITDSCADLTPKEVSDGEITVLPLRFTLDGAVFFDTPDHCNMPLDVFYKRLREGALCKTAGVGMSAFSKAFETVLESGRDVLCICFSGALSSTCKFAKAAADELSCRYKNGRIEVIDSLAVTRGQGMLVLTAAKYRHEGKSLDETASLIRALIPGLCQWFTVDDLDFLRRGGRLNGAGAFLGTVLSVKPLIHTDDEGLLTPVGKIRGRQQSLSALTDTVSKHCEGAFENLTVFMAHADCMESAEFVKSLLFDRFGIKNVNTGWLGPVCGSHAGPGTLYISFFGTKR